MSNVTLYQGDCLEEMKKIPDESIDLILTDPPYGTTVCKWDSIIPLEPMWKQLKRIVKKNNAIILFGKEPFNSVLRMSNTGMFKYDWIWKKDTKSNFPQAAFQPLNNLEIITVFSEGYARNFPKNSPHLDNLMVYNPQMEDGLEYKIPKESKGTEIFRLNNKQSKYQHKKRDTKKRYPHNIIKINTDKKRVHPTQKPVALMEYLIKTYTNEGDTVLDFTMGSGTTGVACKQTNRNFIGIELDEDYFKIAKKRIDEAALIVDVKLEVESEDSPEQILF